MKIHFCTESEHHERISDIIPKRISLWNCPMFPNSVIPKEVILQTVMTIAVKYEIFFTCI